MSRKTAILLVVILVLAGVARILSFRGFVGSDDGLYSESAFEIANGDFRIVGDRDEDIVVQLRVGLLTPTALGFKVAGVNEIVMITYPFTISMLGIILAFLAGRAFFDERAGLIAAAIQAILPIDTRYASMLWPDLPAAFWANVGILLLYYGSKQASRALKATYAVLAGLALGLAWLTKESTPYLLPFIGIYMVWLTYRQRRNLVLLVGMTLTVAAVVMVESLIYYMHTGDLFYRFHKIYGIAQLGWTFFGWSPLASIRPGESEGGYWFAVVKRILKDGPMTIVVNRNFGFVTGLAVLAVGYASFRRLRSFILPGVWFFSLAVVFNFGSTSLQSYKPFLLVDRYLYLILLPAVILSAGLIDALIPSRGFIEREIDRERLFWGSVLALGIAFICLLGVYGNIRTGIGSPVERTVAHILEPGDPIYTDSRTAEVLRFFWKYPKETGIRDFEGMGINNMPTGVYVFINRDRVEFLNLNYGYVRPSFYKDAPSEWLLKWHGDHAELYWVPTEAMPDSR